MKDSQHPLANLVAGIKYIKESNERFSTVRFSPDGME